MYLAENLKFLREQRGKTQQELAKLFGVEQKTFQALQEPFPLCPRIQLVCHIFRKSYVDDYKKIESTFSISIYELESS